MSTRETFVFEGALCDYQTGATIRGNYSVHARNIRSGQDLRATLRAGPYAWPGGDQLAMVTDDGALLCFDCVREELANVLWSIRHDCSNGWRVNACTVVHDGENEDGERCEHCARLLAEGVES